ncbi:hypothetical protein ACRQ5Q_36370 [Bradyrhizobium sp. PMVTL-01]|uniref:hypothetical protein n=1 Tax=Bradyrhizobium sp. PMVTL-01 TaxID=3434999 RepID=UPI003F714115
MTTRSARPDDAGFIVQTILSAQRGYRSRGWFDVALGWPEAQCRDFIARIAVARAYAGAGFVFADEKRDPAFEAIIGAPGFRMFAREI